MNDTNHFEAVTPESEVAVKRSMVEELWNKSKQTWERLKNDPTIAEVNQREQERVKRDLILVGLTLLEAVPMAELVNEGSKWASVLKSLAEKAPEVKKKGSIVGFIPDLYPNIPDWFVAGMATLDTMGAPYVGVAPEVLQLGYDTLWEGPKNQVEAGRVAVDTIRDIWFKKSEYNQEQVNQAMLAFQEEV